MPSRRASPSSWSRSTRTSTLDVPVDDLAVHEPDYKHLIAFLKAMEFTTLTRRVAETVRHRGRARSRPNAKLTSGAAPLIACRRPVRRRRRSRRAAATGDLFARPSPTLPRRRQGARRASGKAAANGNLTPAALAAAHLAAAQAGKIDRCKYETVRTLDRLNAWIARASDVGVVAIDTETTSLDPMQAQLVRLLARGRRQRGLLRADRPSRRRHQGGGDLFAPEAAALRPARSRRRTRSPRSSRCWKTPACSRSGRT